VPLLRAARGFQARADMTTRLPACSTTGNFSRAGWKKGEVGETMCHLPHAPSEITAIHGGQLLDSYTPGPRLLESGEYVTEVFKYM